MPAESLAELARTRPVAPPAECVAIAQDRVREKAHFARCAARAAQAPSGRGGVAPAPYAVIETEVDLSAVPGALLPGILKTARMGYDGKGQGARRRPRRTGNRVARHGRRRLRAGATAAAGL